VLLGGVHLHVKKVEKNDIQRVLDLFAVADPRHIRNISFYLWRNFNNPFGESLSYVILDGNSEVPIGHYSFSPCYFSFFNKRFKVALAQQAVIHPDYRSSSNIYKLANFALNDLKKQGFDFVFGFPNDKFRLVQEKLLRWDQICIFPAKVFSISSILKESTVTDNFPRYTFKRVNKKDLEQRKEEIDKYLTEKNENNQSKLKMLVDTKWLEWRFFNNPREHYILFLAEINKHFAGIIVVKPFYNGEELIGHIVHLEGTNSAVVKGLIYQGLHYLFKELKVQKLVNWPLSFLNLDNSMITKGFYTNLYSKNLNLSKSEYSKITCISNWELHMSYSDVF